MTYMQSEILQTPSILSKVFEENFDTLKEVAKAVQKKGISSIIVAARGSSMNAGFILKNLVESNAENLLVTFELPSLATLYKAKRDLKNALYVIVSQSGASTDTINMLNEAKTNGALTLAVTNNSQSVCAKSADFHLNLCAGEEKAVAATKTFTSEVFAMMLLARALSSSLNSFDIDALSDSAEKLLHSELPTIPAQLKNACGVMVLSRGITECIAKECGLKLMECCYKFVYTGTTNEFQHGPKALLASQQPVVLIAPSGSMGIHNNDNYIATAKLLRELDTHLIAITDIDEVKKVADLCLPLPLQKDGSEAILSALQVQRLVLSLSLAQGLNPDAPRNLKKVTITK